MTGQPTSSEKDKVSDKGKQGGTEIHSVTKGMPVQCSLAYSSMHISTTPSESEKTKEEVDELPKVKSYQESVVLQLQVEPSGQGGHSPSMESSK